MNVIGLWLCLVILLISAHRLPAPISEVPESPTPSLEQSAEPKTKRTTKRQTANRNSFAGTWAGTISQGIWGNVDYSFTINAAGTAVVEKSRLGTATQRATWNGKAATWRSGVFLKEIAWTLTPNPDRKTALVVCSSPFYGTPSAVFRKTSP
jgi:hypothetical protein